MIGLLIYYNDDIASVYNLLDSIKKNTSMEYQPIIIADNVEMFLEDKHQDCVVIQTNYNNKFQSFNKACEKISNPQVCFLTENCSVLSKGWLKCLNESLKESDLAAPMLYTKDPESHSFWGHAISLLPDSSIEKNAKGYSKKTSSDNNKALEKQKVAEGVSELEEQESKFLDLSTSIFPLGFLVEKSKWMDIGCWDLEPPCEEFKTLDKIIGYGWDIQKVAEAKILVG